MKQTADGNLKPPTSPAARFQSRSACGCAVARGHRSKTCLPRARPGYECVDYLKRVQRIAVVGGVHLGVKNGETVVLVKKAADAGEKIGLVGRAGHDSPLGICALVAVPAAKRAHVACDQFALVVAAIFLQSSNSLCLRNQKATQTMQKLHDAISVIVIKTKQTGIGFSLADGSNFLGFELARHPT